jgi:SAM-dependent methyltransferase
MTRVIERVFRQEKPRVLDLGPFSGDTAIYLADRGARVSVTEFVPPLPTPAPEAGSSVEPAPPPALHIDEPDASFDLVLVWEWLDFTPPDRLGDFAAELRRILAGGGWLLLFALNDPSVKDPAMRKPGRYRLVEENRLLRTPFEEVARRRWTHPTREIERALEPLSIQGIHLQRSQMREFLALKKVTSTPKAGRGKP